MVTLIESGNTCPAGHVVKGIDGTVMVDTKILIWGINLLLM